MMTKFTNIRRGYATVTDERGREIGEVYFADEIVNERGQTVFTAGWVPVTLDNMSHANAPRFPQFQTRNAAARALAHGEVIR